MSNLTLYKYKNFIKFLLSYGLNIVLFSQDSIILFLCLFTCFILHTHLGKVCLSGKHLIFLVSFCWKGNQALEQSYHNTITFQVFFHRFKFFHICFPMSYKPTSPVFGPLVHWYSPHLNWIPNNIYQIKFLKDLRKSFTVKLSYIWAQLPNVCSQEDHLLLNF